MEMLHIDKDSLKEICSVTVRLAELHQNECKCLSIGDFAPELFGKLLDVYLSRARYQYKEVKK